MKLTLRKSLIWSCVGCIIPMLPGAILYGRLPARMATHFGPDNMPDGYSAKPMALFGIPLFILAMNIFLHFMLENDPKKRGISKAIKTTALLCMPVVCIVTQGLIITAGLGYNIDFARFIPIFIGVLFVIIGNYLPKCRQNYTTGIKLPWTLNSEENWNRTHRLAGKLWVVAGVGMVVAGIFKIPYLQWFLLLPACVIPAVYSYWFYRKEKN